MWSPLLLVAIKFLVPEDHDDLPNSGGKNELGLMGILVGFQTRVGQSQTSGDS